MLQSDSDFAAAFTSWDDAMGAGGSAVADAWMEATAVVDDSQLLRAVDDAQAAAHSRQQEERPPLARYMKPLCSIKRGRSRLRRRRWRRMTWPDPLTEHGARLQAGIAPRSS